MAGGGKGERSLSYTLQNMTTSWAVPIAARHSPHQLGVARQRKTTELC